MKVEENQHITLSTRHQKIGLLTTNNGSSGEGGVDKSSTGGGGCVVSHATKADPMSSSSSSSSSDGSEDSGCLAESPELGSKDDAYHSDSTPELSNSQHLPPPPRQDTPPPPPPPHTHLNGNEVDDKEPPASFITAGDPTTQWGGGDVHEQQSNNQKPQPKVVTSYFQINCNKGDIISLSSTFADDGKKTDKSSYSTRVVYIDNNNPESIEPLQRTHDIRTQVSPNTRNTQRSNSQATNNQTNSKPHEFHKTNLVLHCDNASPASLDSANANCQREITLSLSQLSDFETTKQKIAELRHSFMLANLASCDQQQEEIPASNNVPNSNTSFLAQLQDKRAKRLQQRLEKQNLQRAEPTPKGDGYNNNNNNVFSGVVPIKEYYPQDHSCVISNQIKKSHIEQQYRLAAEGRALDAPQYNHYNRNFIPYNVPNASLDMINANMGGCGVGRTTSQPSPPAHASSLPPTANSSPIRYQSAGVEGLNVRTNQVWKTSSTPNTPFRSVPVPAGRNESPLRKICLQNQLGQCYNECVMSRSADSKTSFNSVDEDDSNVPQSNRIAYLRTRSLEDSTWSPKGHKHEMISSSPNKKSSKLSSSSRSVLSSLNCTKHSHYESPSMLKLQKSELIQLRDDNSDSHSNSSSSNNNAANVWLRDKTNKLLKLKKHRRDKSFKGNAIKHQDCSESSDTKVRLKEACKGMARALFSYPNNDRSRVTRSHSPPSTVAVPPSPPAPPYGLPEDSPRDSSLSRQVRRRQHLLYAAESSPRNSFHYSCVCPNKSEPCKCPLSRYRQGWDAGGRAAINSRTSAVINRPCSAPNIRDSDVCQHTFTAAPLLLPSASPPPAPPVHFSSPPPPLLPSSGRMRECRIIGELRDNRKREVEEEEEESSVCPSTSDDDYASEDSDNAWCSTCEDLCDNNEGDEKKGIRRCSKRCNGGQEMQSGVARRGGRVHMKRIRARSERSMMIAVVPGEVDSNLGVTAVTPGLRQTRTAVNRRRRRHVSSPSAVAAVQSLYQQQPKGHQQQLSLRAIHESCYGAASDTPHCASEEELLSRDGSNCDLSRSWRYGLSRGDAFHSKDSTLCSEDSCATSASSLLCSNDSFVVHGGKSNSLPGAYNRPLPADTNRPRPGSAILRPRSTCEEDIVGRTFSSLDCSPPTLPNVPPPPFIPMRSPVPPPPLSCGRPTMGVQSLQRSPNIARTSPLPLPGLPPSSPRLLPRTVAPRSPNNPNPPYGFTQHVNSCYPPPGSPRTSSRAKGLVSRNFSISDDEGCQRSGLSRRLVTIVRNESVYSKEAQLQKPVDPDWVTWKLGVLLKTLEDVDGCIDDADKTVASWGPVPPQEQAEQHVTAVTKFRENLADLQRGIDDVNDQAARFSAHNVPLAPDTSTRLHRLNSRWKTLEGAVNERWRQVAGRSRDITPLTAAQLASSVSQPWERAVANNKVPYYINHAQENTYWDHPEMMALLESLADLNHIKFSAYRTASKLRALQKKLALDEANLQLVTDVFDEHGLRGQNDRLIDVSDMVVVLSTLYGRIAADRPELNTNLTTDLCLNWLLNVYDSQRTGQMRVLSFRVGLVCLCKGHLEEKYRYMFRLIADPNRLVDQRKLGLLLHDCVQVPRQLGEVAAFGGSNIEPSVRSCFTKAGKDRDAIEAVHFLTWVQQEPQSLVWLAVLHRVAASEQIQHQVKCNICKTSPIIGLRYRCLKCIGFDMCQQCFFDGRSSKSHKITHPMHEYCTATTAGDEMKDFTKALKNKFKSKRSLQKHTKKGYLPVQTVLEGDPLESPSPSPQHAGGASQDVHNRLEQYASRLAEVELRTNSNSTPDSEDEHGLIAQYCQSLSSGDAAAGGGGGGVPLPVPRSPLQVMAAVDADQKDELEQMIRELEEENQALLAEYEQLKQQPEASESSLSSSPLRSEADMLAEARMLRQHKGRLEARMTILEQHNQQLEAQLQRLRHLLQQSGNSPNKSGTLQTKSVTASQLATDSPAKVNGHPSQGDLEKAVGSLVATVNQSPESGQCSGPTDEPPLLQQRQEEEEEEVEDYDNHPAKRR